MVAVTGPAGAAMRTRGESNVAAARAGDFGQVGRALLDANHSRLDPGGVQDSPEELVEVDGGLAQTVQELGSVSVGQCILGERECVGGDPDAGQWGAKVVADAGQKGRAYAVDLDQPGRVLLLT